MPSSPSFEFPLQSPNERDEFLASADGNPFVSPPHKSRTVHLVPAPAGNGGSTSQFDDAVEEITDRPGLSRSETDKEFVFVDSPKSKTRKQKEISAAAAVVDDIPPVPALPPSISYNGGLSTSGHASRSNSRSNGTSTGEGFRPLDRVKTLPPPPVGQVMPDFGDLVAHQPPPNVRRGSNMEVGDGEGSIGVRRKGSVVKKIKERIK